MLPLALRYFIAIIALGMVAFPAPASAQSFINYYQRYLKNNTDKRYRNTKQLNSYVIRMKEALIADKKTNSNILNSETLYMVHYYNIETGQYTHVVWNSDHSFYYQYRFKQPLTFKPNASEWIKGYKSEFKKWVESADTLNYGKYGRQASWFDVPLIYGCNKE
jgi:hypothetical protein